MMKKFTKAALLLAAGALLLAGLPACSGDDDDDVAVEGVTLNPTELTMTAGEQVKLTATVLPEGADNKEVLWASDNEDAATVDETGLVTAVGTGTATITVTTEDGGYTATCVVTVSDGTGNGGNGGNGGGGGNGNFSTKTDDTTANDVATLGLVGTDTDSSNPSVATANIVGGKIVITSHSAGTAVITVKDGNKEATIKVTVATDGAITIGEITKYNANTVPDPTEKTYAWNFQAADLTTAIDTSPLEAKATYESIPAGLTLVFPEGFKNNQLAPTYSVSSTVTVGASNGTIQPNGGSDGASDMYVEVQGPFTVTMLCSANGSSNVSRTAYIKINGEEKATTGGTVLAAGNKLTAKYEGTEVVKVSFGGTDYFRLFDIQISTENGDGAGKTAGEVKSSAVFDSKTDDTTANDKTTLGLVGTSADSSDQSVATANIVDNKIVITSHNKGTAVITVKDASGNEATIDVTVSSTGTITTKITPYEDTSGVFTIENGVLNLAADKYEYYLSMDNLEDTNGNNAWSSVNATNSANNKSANAPFNVGTKTLDMKSSGNRAITLKVKNVAAIDVYVAGGDDRVYQVAVNNVTAGEDGKADGSGHRFTTGTQDEATIVISTTSSSSVYPVGVILYKEIPQE